MRKSMRMMGLVAGLVAIGATALFAARDSINSVSEQDIADFQEVARAYQTGLNAYNAEALMPHLGTKLDLWMPLAIHIKSPEELRKYLAAMGNLIGIGSGGNYQILSQPKGLIRHYENGTDDVFSAGSHEEQVQFAGKQPQKYTMNWLAHLQRQGGKWKVIGGRLEVAPEGQVFSSAELNTLKQQVVAAMRKSKGGK